MPHGARGLTGTVLGAAVLVTALTVLARVTGFGRSIVFARTVGSTCLNSTYHTVNTVPNIVFEVVAGGALASLVVPLLARAVADRDRAHVDRTASALLTWTVLVLTPLAVLIAVAAEPIARVMLAGTDCGGAVEVGASMLRVFAPQVVLYGVGIVLTGVLQAHRRFGGPALAPLLSSLVVIGAYVTYGVLASRSTDVATLTRPQELVLSVGTTLGVVALSLSLLVPVSRLGLRLRPTLRFPAGVARPVRALAYAGMAILIAQQASVAVALVLGNAAFDVAVAVYAHAQAIYLLPWAVLAVPLATAVFPRLAQSWGAGDREQYARQVAASLCLVVLLCLAAAAALVAASRPLARIVFQDVPGPDNVPALSDAILGFSFGLVGYGLFALLSRALFAAHVTGLTALACVAGWVSVIAADLVLALLLPARERVLALSIGNSVGMTILGAALLAAVTATAGPAVTANLTRLLLVGLPAAGVAGWLGRELQEVIDSGGVWAAAAQAGLTGAVTVAVFVALVALFARGTVVHSVTLLRSSRADHGSAVRVH